MNKLACIFGLIIVLLINAVSAQENGRFLKAVELASSGFYKQAQQEFQWILKEDPFHKLATLNLEILTKLQQGAYRTQIASDVFTCMKKISRNEWEQALKVFEEDNIFVKVDPCVLFCKGYIYYRLGMQDAALQRFILALKDRPDHPVFLFYKARALNASDEHQVAIRNYDRLLQLTPNDPEIYAARAESWSATGKSRNAIDDYSCAIEIDPKYALAYHNRGVEYYSTGKIDSAISDYSQAIQIQNDFAAAWLNRGLAFFIKENYSDAIRDLKKAVSLDPKNASAWIHLAQAESRKGQFTSAKACYEKAISLAPDQPAHYFAKATMLDSLSRFQEAYDIYKAFTKMISDQDTLKNDLYKSAKQRLAELRSPRMHLAVILLQSEATANTVLTKLKNGADFATLAGQYSRGPGKNSSGDIGLVYPSDLNSELAAAVRSLKVGEISRVIKAGGDFYIVKKVGEEAALIQTQ